jgi:hypothetical protein
MFRFLAGRGEWAGALRLAMSNIQCSIQRHFSDSGANRPMPVPLVAFLLHSQRQIDHWWCWAAAST